MTPQAPPPPPRPTVIVIERPSGAWRAIKAIFAVLLLLWSVGFAMRNRSHSTSPPPVKSGNVKGGKWGTSEGASSFDDSAMIRLSLPADSPITGWPRKTTTPLLMLRCKENKTEVAIWTGMSHLVERGLFQKATVRLRFDSDQAFTEEASESTDNNGLFLPESIVLIRLMLEHDRMLFGFTPFNSPSVEASFDLRGLKEVIGPLQSTCGWR